MCFIGFFFFSSRRRHTIFKCDWSSDVCSSDLQRPPIGCVPFPIRRVKDPGLLPRCTQEGAVAVRMDLHVVLAHEAEPVPAPCVMKGVVGEFELLGSGTNGRNCRSKFQISHHRTLLCLWRINATRPWLDTHPPKKFPSRVPA